MHLEGIDFLGLNIDEIVEGSKAVGNTALLGNLRKHYLKRFQLIRIESPCAVAGNINHAEQSLFIAQQQICQKTSVKIAFRMESLNVLVESHLTTQNTDRYIFE